jgi:hypothetical protein
MSPSGPQRLGQISGKATYDQGVSETAQDATMCPPEKRSGEAHRPSNPTEINESPNESSYGQLESPRVERERWAPRDHMMLYLILGLFALIAMCLVTGSSLTGQIIQLLAVVIAYFFGKESRQRR